MRFIYLIFFIGTSMCFGQLQYSYLNQGTISICSAPNHSALGKSVSIVNTEELKLKELNTQEIEFRYSMPVMEPKDAETYPLRILEPDSSCKHQLLIVEPTMDSEVDQITFKV